jgi:putative transposase
MSTRSSTSWYVYRAAASVARRTWRLLSRNKLSVAERASVLATLNHESFVDNSVAQVWATLPDEGSYLCSESTMYRILGEAGGARERHRQATHPRGPGRSWSPTHRGRCGPGTSRNCMDP